MWAILCGQQEIAQLLISKGLVDLNMKDKDGWTALHFAVDLGQDRVVMLLVR